MKESPLIRRRQWGTWILRVVLMASVLGVVGLLVAALGLPSIRASAGHWAVTRWFLEFTKRRSVSTHSLGTPAPFLADPNRVLRGAGHFEMGCSPCHGSPVAAPPKIPARMTPHPPHLADRIERWKPRELFELVKHGIKMTGMPAWPVPDRDDEVWDLVAFLVAMPRMESSEYLAQARGPDAQPGPEVLRDVTMLRGGSLQCGNCHGWDGQGRDAFPTLAGQREDYLRNALAAYARNERSSGTMGPIAADLEPHAIDAVAKYYAGLAPTAAPSPTARSMEAGESISRGRTIAMEGIPGQKVPSCADCHGPAGASHNPAYPILAGQNAAYLVLQLELFRDNRRGGSRFAHLMDEVAFRLTADQMRDVAAFYASTPPATAGP